MVSDASRAAVVAEGTTLEKLKLVNGVPVRVCMVVLVTVVTEVIVVAMNLSQLRCILIWHIV